MDLVSTLIRTGINKLDSRREAAEASDQKEHTRTLIGTHHASFGSPSPDHGFEDLETLFPGDAAFSGFRLRLNKWFWEKGLLPRNKRIEGGLKVSPICM